MAGPGPRVEAARPPAGRPSQAAACPQLSSFQSCSPANTPLCRNEAFDNVRGGGRARVRRPRRGTERPVQLRVPEPRQFNRPEQPPHPVRREEGGAQGGLASTNEKTLEHRVHLPRTRLAGSSRARGAQRPRVAARRARGRGAAAEDLGDGVVVDARTHAPHAHARRAGRAMSYLDGRTHAFVMGGAGTPPAVPHSTRDTPLTT